MSHGKATGTAQDGMPDGDVNKLGKGADAVPAADIELSHGTHKQKALASLLVREPRALRTVVTISGGAILAEQSGAVQQQGSFLHSRGLLTGVGFSFQGVPSSKLVCRGRGGACCELSVRPRRHRAMRFVSPPRLGA
eukprot:1159773-Pelagomonas_calceolata.AAC.3